MTGTSDIRLGEDDTESGRNEKDEKRTRRKDTKWVTNP